MSAAFTKQVDVGGGALMTIVNPRGDPSIEWMLRYAGDLNDLSYGRFAAASLIANYDYLLSDQITLKEATARLRLMRIARRAAAKPTEPTLPT